MDIKDFFVFEGFDEEVNVKASERDFQQSIVITQDKNKSGILSFLKEREEQASPRPERRIPQTFTPRREGGY